MFQYNKIMLVSKLSALLFAGDPETELTFQKELIDLVDAVVFIGAVPSRSSTYLTQKAINETSLGELFIMLSESGKSDAAIARMITKMFIQCQI